MSPKTKTVSLEEFLEMDKGENRFEYFNGEVISLPSPSVEHQRFLLNIAAEFRNYFKGKTYYGVPALIIEIISSSNESHDRVKKYIIYMEFGVKEYWMVNPKLRTIEVYVLEEDEYKQAAIFKGSECSVSESFDELEIYLEEIFSNS